MAFSLYQQTTNYSNGSINLTTLAGDLLVAFVSGCDGTNEGTTVSGGGTWHSLPFSKWTVGTQVGGLLCYCLSATGGASTFSLTNPPNNDCGWGIKEFKGASAWALDLHSEGSATTSNSISSGAVNTNHAVELLVAFFADETNNISSWSSSWINASDTELNAIHYDNFIDGVVTSQGSYAATGTNSTTYLSGHTWICNIASFYDSGGGSSSAFPEPFFWWNNPYAA
ncbi:MAG: hypothetical protein ACLPXB_05070 [Thiobacillaceae bacterium]